jgi:hypothetical protein
VADDEVQAGGLSDDHGVNLDVGGLDVGQDLLGTDRGVLLVGDEGDYDVAAVRVVVNATSGDHQGGDAGLHVVASPAVQPVGFQKLARACDVRRGPFHRAGVITDVWLRLLYLIL